MSRITLKRGNYTIVCGWDAPFQHYFASIETPEDEDFPWYSTLDDPDATIGGGFHALEDVRTRVEAKVGTLPEEYWDAVQVQDMNTFRTIEDFKGLQGAEHFVWPENDGKTKN